ncbi:MAG: glycosyltransferase [Rhodobacteraceae bacterium]|nr:glycosyltransferase [Paracoccaceae bacterium]
MAPRCSLLVLTYNQERFVADAVRAALAQEGPPVEIIISDDGSVDDTFAVAEACVAGYDGPHEVILNRNATNMGAIAHTNHVVGMARGDILIPAYGDDIAFPDRALRIAQAFEAHDPLLVHSHAVPIDGDGCETTSAYGNAAFFRTTDPLEVATSLFHYLGASGAWARALFDRYGPIDSPLVYDDHILGFRAALEGRVQLIDAPLLYYREGVGISHLAGAGKDRTVNRQRRQKILRQSQAVFAARLADARRFGLGEDHPVVTRLQQAELRAGQRLAYYEGGAALRAGIARHPLGALGALAGEALRDIRKR